MSARNRRIRRVWHVVRSGEMCDRKVISSHRKKSGALEVARILIRRADRREAFFVAHESDSFYGPAAVRAWMGM